MKTRRDQLLRTQAVEVPASRKLRVHIVADPEKERSQDMARRLVARIEERTEVTGVDMERRDGPFEGRPDIVIVLGGDGAMLATSWRLGNRQVPVMGINLGRVGFLAAVAPDRAMTVLETVLSGKAKTECHAMMQTRIRRNGVVLVDTHVLNEVVVDSPASRMLDIDLTVDRRPVCTYRGDGLIVATATGSTAYSLAAGGPILSPRLDAFLVTPLAPHMLTQRPLVLPGERVASLRVQAQARFTADGHEAHPLEKGDVVRIGPSPRRFQLIVDPEANFYARLRSKLHWGRPPGPG